MDSLWLVPWSENDLDLLHAANTTEMTAHLNGSETADEIEARHLRYLRLQGEGEAKMFVIVDAAGARLGSIGCWKVLWRGEPALETGWFVLPDAQGRGIASSALALLIDVLRSDEVAPQVLMACPGVDNPASNAVCRKAGFRLVGTITELFRGAPLAVNEWVLEITS